MIILDTTLRDGSYAVDFKFSMEDTADLVARSARIGAEYIEIGHGQGLNASSLEHGVALCTDEEYMDAGREAAGHSKLGFFCIPGIAKLANLNTAKEHGMDYIRIGVTADRIKEAIPFIEEAELKGLEAFVNFMKTYASSPDEFAKAAKMAAEAGARCVYIVDSAGSMTEEELSKYIEAVRRVSEIPLGFHGHNNLGLAVSNSMFCVRHGVEYVDASFQGLGRSLGNASFEQLVMALERCGYSTGFDIPRVLEYGYAGLRGIVPGRLVNPLDYVCGYAGFHSGFLKDIYRCCREKRVDPLRLILAYSKEDQKTMDYNLLLKTAETLPEDTGDNPYSFGEYFSERYRG